MFLFGDLQVIEGGIYGTVFPRTNGLCSLFLWLHVPGRGVCPFPPYAPGVDLLEFCSVGFGFFELIESHRVYLIYLLGRVSDHSLPFIGERIAVSSPRIGKYGMAANILPSTPPDI